eukprot:scaffold18873_cov112-Isochrysis_galbana.AAC.6
MRSKHAEAQLSSQPEAAHRPEACLQVARAAARDDMHRVGRVGGQRLQAVECGRRRCQGAADEVMEEFEVIQHLLLLDERAVQAQHDQPAVGLPVGAHEGLGRQRRQRLARQRLGAKVAQPERGARGRLSGGQAGAGAAHVLHGHVEPGGSGVRGDEGVVLGEAGGALVGRHGEGCVGARETGTGEMSGVQRACRTSARTGAAGGVQGQPTRGLGAARRRARRGRNTGGGEEGCALAR